MIEKLRRKIITFIESDKDVPLLAGFSIGFYIILFYYSKNFGLAYSWGQFLFFLGYFVAMPSIALFAGYKILGIIKLHRWQKNYIFLGMIAFFTLFLLQINYTWLNKKIILVVVLLLAFLISLKFKRYYKLLIVLLLFISIFNMKPLAGIAYRTIPLTDDWKKQPDDIENVVLNRKPNIYYIQPDGYTSFKNLAENKYYDFDNSDYEAFLKQAGFTLYDDYRSNYYSTLLSNAATFSMKHHYMQTDIDLYAAREIIAGDNPVIRILKNNGYKTSFITQNPYILMSRPKLGYDFCNISYNEMPYFGDGFFSIEKDVDEDLKKQISVNTNSGNFYFVERFLPGHISTYETTTEGAEAEQAKYIAKLKTSNAWLKDLIRHITTNDPMAIIIIGADHGGFTGFEYTMQSKNKINDSSLIKSVFGAQLAIKWNKPPDGYDDALNSGVNLFRVVFARLADDKKYLEGMQDNSSYIALESPKGLYRYIDNSGNIIFEKYYR